MAKRRRRRGEQPKKQVDEKSKNFFVMLGIIGAVLLLVFLALNFM